jgi:hypothetical protein
MTKNLGSGSQQHFMLGKTNRALIDTFTLWLNWIMGI